LVADSIEGYAAIFAERNLILCAGFLAHRHDELIA